jgi:predicted ferric reductase
MAAVTPTVARAATAPAVTAQVVAGAVVAVNLVVVELLFVAGGAGKNSVLTVAKFFGLHAALIMMIQLLLVARLPWLDRRLGMDRLTAWHRWVGFTLLWTVVTHATLVVVGYATLYGMPVFATVASLAGVAASLLGMSAATVIVGVAVVSMRYARRRLPYEAWHAVHLGLYAAVALALLHQMLEGTTFTASPVAAVYWWTLWTLVLGALVAGRIVVPLWRNARHRFRVAAVVPESDTAVSVYVTGRHLDRLPARAGQFCIWRFPDHNGWWQANPFSLSAAPGGRLSLRLTAKAVGATSAGLRTLPVGSRVFVEGPYGAFTGLQQRTGATLLVAGGIGVTPIRALLEESAWGSAVVLYRVSTAADAVLLGELRELARLRGAVLHVLAGRTGGNPPVRPFDPANLAALVPDIRHRDVYVCGPSAMTEAVLRSVRTLGVPRAQVHAERFGLG